MVLPAEGSIDNVLRGHDHEGVRDGKEQGLYLKTQ